MDRNTAAQPNEWDGDDELPDVPDAGDGAQPLVPPDPIDISTGTIAADGAQLAATAGDDRTLYEQALEVFEDDHPSEAPAAEAPDGGRATPAPDDEGGARVYPD